MSRQDLVDLIRKHESIEIVSGARTFHYLPYYQLGHTSIQYCDYIRVGTPDMVMNASVCMYEIAVNPTDAWLDAAERIGTVYLPQMDGRTYKLSLVDGVWRKELAHPRTAYTLSAK